MSKMVFISHSSEDKEFAKKLGDALRKHGLRIWVDFESIKVAARWPDEISRALEDCHVVLAIQSEKSIVYSYQCKGEWAHALDIHKPVIPVFHGNEKITTPHKLLKDRQSSRIRDESFEADIEILVKEIMDGQPSVRDAEFVLEDSLTPVEFPRFYNQDGAQYSEFIRASHSIYFSSSTGYTFIRDCMNTLKHKLLSGPITNQHFYFILAQPSENTIRHLASWSAWRWMRDIGFAYQEILKVLNDSANALEDLTRIGGDKVELRVQDYLAPVPMIMSDPQSQQGKIIIGIYSFGPSVEPEILRPGTILTQRNAGRLYHHFHQVYENMWATAKPITPEGLKKLISAIPQEYNVSG